MWLWPSLGLVGMLACLAVGLLVLVLLELIEKRFPRKKQRGPVDKS
jgi:hypothetical protein